jgi:hypothetical protein
MDCERRGEGPERPDGTCGPIVESQHANLIPVGIAIASLIVVPALVAICKHYVGVWREARHARLAKLLVQREEFEMQFSELSETQAKQHAENREMLERIRAEGQERERTLLGAVSEVHARVDTLFGLLAKRKP